MHMSSSSGHPSSSVNSASYGKLVSELPYISAVNKIFCCLFVSLALFGVVAVTVFVCHTLEHRHVFHGEAAFEVKTCADWGFCDKVSLAKCENDGLTFIGLSFARTNDAWGNNDTVTHQQQLNLNLIQDREYLWVGKTDDSGWLCGGGEPFVSASNKLDAHDSCHAEIWHSGSTDPNQGGMSIQDIITKMEKISFGNLKVSPDYVHVTEDNEMELRWKLDKNSELYHLFEKLRDTFPNPCSEPGSPFHTTLARKVSFRSVTHMEEFLDRTRRVILQWNKEYPNGVTLGVNGVNGGAHLFRNRENIVHYFSPSVI